MKKIKMIRTEKGSIDGFTVNKYMAGVEYNLPFELANAFLNIGSAELITETMAMQDKMIETIEKVGKIADKATKELTDFLETETFFETENKDKPETVKKSKRKRTYTKKNKA